MNKKQKSEASASASNVSLVPASIKNLELIVENMKTQRDYYHKLSDGASDRNLKTGFGLVADKLHQHAMSVQSEVVALKSALAETSKFDAGVACPNCGGGVLLKYPDRLGVVYKCDECDAKYGSIAGWIAPQKPKSDGYPNLV